MKGISLPKDWEAWQLTEELGRGSYGAVYRAQRRIGDVTRESAIKIIRIPGEEDEARLAMLELGGEDAARAYYKSVADEYIREIQVMYDLKGITNIVSVEDFTLLEDSGALEWTIFIRMELLESFRQYQQRHTLSENDVLRLGSDLCTALGFCEKAGILHRDIKPDNILVSPMGSFKLGDFGVARRLTHSGSKYSYKGTSAYMAPEVAAGQPYDHRADIYSLGLVLYRLLNRNREPFLSADKQVVTQRDREEALARRLSGEALPKPADASPKMAEVLLKACAFLQRDRYQSAAAFGAALSALQHGAAKPAKRKRKGLGVLALLLPLLLAVFAAFYLTSDAGGAFARDLLGRVSGILKPAQPVQPGQPLKDTRPDPQARTRAVALGSGTAGITFFGKTARVWVNAGAARLALREAGLEMDEAEAVSFRQSLRQQFVFEGKSEGLVPGDTVTLVFRPDGDFTAFLAQRGIEARFDTKTRAFPGN